MLFHVWLGYQPFNFKQHFLILVFGFGIDLLKLAGKTKKLWAFCHGCFRASHVFVFILSWFPQNLHIRFAESANYLASLDFSIVIIGIFLFDFSWNSMHFAYSHMAFIGICPHNFAFSDLFRVATDDTEFLSGSMVFVIILSTLSKSKRIFLFYLSNNLALFSLSLQVCIEPFYYV